MAAITFDVTKFRDMFPKFADPIDYPDAYLQQWWDIATCYISDANCGPLNGACRQNAIMMMLAHLIYIQDQIEAGGDTGVVTSASVGDVSVSVQAPSDSTQFRWWLNQSTYGKQLASMLGSMSFGFYVGGSRETSAFRKSGGRF